VSASAQTASDLVVRFPQVSGETPDQDREFCEVLVEGQRRRIRFHDYDEIYRVPGLYEAIFHEHLKCTSPEVVVGLLADELERAGVDPATLRGLDVGAGNGLIGEQLSRIGVSSLIGVDLLPEAAEAAERDRPGLYDDYVACDLTAMSRSEKERIRANEPNLLTTVAALGFGDIPCDAFVTAYNAVADGGWVAFNIRADFLDATDKSGFAQLVDRMLAEGILEERTRKRYDHRLSMAGDAIEYVAIIGLKRADGPLGVC
jgi:predicted TPR repeat methyltransferase